MTQGNLNRLNLVIARLNDLVRANQQLDAQQHALALLDQQAHIQVVLIDLVLRPEVNS